MPTDIPETPQTREETYLAAANGQEEVELPDPMTREEAYLHEIATKMQGGGGGGVTVEPLSVSENGMYPAEPGKAWNPVTVAVPLNVGITESISNLSSRYQNAVFSPPINKLTVHNTNSYAVSAANICNSLTGVSELDITVDNGITNLNYAFYGCKATRITIHSDTSSVTNYNDAFSGNNNETFFVTVDGDALDLSSATGLLNMIGKRIKEIRFVPNTAKVNWQMNVCENISDDTLVSIANALDGTATGLTLTIHATPKARCQTLMGTVSGGLFTIDAGGTVTLADFITQTKGWTLA